MLPHRQWMYEEDGAERQEGDSAILHDPWEAATVSTASAVSGEKLVDQPDRSSFLGRIFPARRVTPGRIAAFAVVALIISLAFMVSIFAVAASVRPPASVSHTAGARSRPVPTARPVATPQPSMGETKDTFHRQQELTGDWGAAPGGEAWHIADEQKPAFSVVGNSGQIHAIRPGTNFYTATLGPGSTNGTVEGAVTFIMKGFVKQQSTNVGVVLRWQDSTTYYKAYLDGAQFVIMKNVQGTQTVLTHIPFAAMNGTLYTLRFRAEGPMLMAKAWEAKEQQEPPTWMLQTDDGDLLTGTVDVRALLAPGDSVQVTTFTVAQAQ